MSKPSLSNGEPVNYIAATYLNQNVSGDTDVMIRYADPTNCFRFYNGMSLDINSLGQRIYYGYTKTVPKGIDASWTKHRFLPTALYVSGFQKNTEGMTLDDIVITESKVDGTVVDLSGEKTLSGESASGSFYPVVDMKDPNETEPFNLGYPDFYRVDGKEELPVVKNQPYFIYLKGAREDKRPYISSLSVGSFSRAQYGSSDKKVLQAVDNVVDNTALIQAACGGADEVIMYNLGVDGAGQGKAWYRYTNTTWLADTPFYGMANDKAPEDVPAAYIGVTRTDKRSEAITGVLLWQKDDVNTAGNEMTYDGVKYTCDSPSSPIYMQGKKYYLYYTKNSGVAPGLPIEEIKIDNIPMISGYATNLSGDSRHSKPYGNPNQTAFIHLKYTAATGDFFNNIYIATGATKRAAMCELLTQGCVESMDIDLNSGVNGESMVMGFRRGHIDEAELAKAKNEEERKKTLINRTQEAIYDVIITNGEDFHKDGFVKRNMFYYPANDKNLNGKNGDKLYMYVATPWYSEKYNPQQQRKDPPAAERLYGLLLEPCLRKGRQSAVQHLGKDRRGEQQRQVGVYYGSRPHQPFRPQQRRNKLQRRICQRLPHINVRQKKRRLSKTRRRNNRRICRVELRGGGDLVIDN